MGLPGSLSVEDDTHHELAEGILRSQGPPCGGGRNGQSLHICPSLRGSSRGREAWTNIRRQVSGSHPASHLLSPRRNFLGGITVHVTPCMPGALPASGMPHQRPPPPPGAALPLIQGHPGHPPVLLCQAEAGAEARELPQTRLPSGSRWGRGETGPQVPAPVWVCFSTYRMWGFVLNASCRLHGSAPPALPKRHLSGAGRESELHSSTCAREQGRSQRAPAAEVGQQPAGSGFLLSADLSSGIWVPCLRGPALPEGAQGRRVAGCSVGARRLGWRALSPTLQERGRAGCSQPRPTGTKAEGQGGLGQPSFVVSLAPLDHK